MIYEMIMLPIPCIWWYREVLILPTSTYLYLDTSSCKAAAVHNTRDGRVDTQQQHPAAAAAGLGCLKSAEHSLLSS